jgi:hypothetical protein
MEEKLFKQSYKKINIKINNLIKILYNGWKAGGNGYFG